VDGTKVRANASKHKAMSYQRMQQEEQRLSDEIASMCRQAGDVDAAEDARFGADRRGDEVPDELAHRESRLEKIRAAKRALVTSDFMIIARIESLIMGRPLDEALERARAYIEAAADGIMIHSAQKTSDEILTFCEEYRKFDRRVPLVVVPTSYNSITEKELVDAGVDVVIYANHLLR
ncbi:MAG: isocitrate lyase/phosphoenolpyruvate mutase family protein, partial [Bradymonadaceae bacterium]